MPRNLRDIEILHNSFEPEIDNPWMHAIAQRIAKERWKKPESLYNGAFFTRSALKYVHFPHIDPTDPNKIRFYESIANGRKDRMTSMRIGRYLTKFFKSHLGTEGEILKIQQQIVYETAPIEVFFASTEEEVVQVYQQGPRSCMSKSLDVFQSEVHPCTAYIAGDLQVAWTKNVDGSKPGARAVVWPDKKSYVRIYGDSSRLKRGLTDLGYKIASGFEGARLKRIPYRGTFTVPYVDGNARYVQPDYDTDALILRTDGSGGSLVDGHPSYEIGSEWGWLWEPDSLCELCESVSVDGAFPGADLTGKIVIDANGQRFILNVCEPHWADDNLLEDYGLLRCSRCGTWSLPHNHEYELNTYGGETHVCARCIPR